MTESKLTLEQETLMLGNVRPGPEVFILAYAGKSFKNWKLVAMCSKEEYRQMDDWEAEAQRKFPSATMLRVYMVNDENRPLDSAPARIN